MTGPLSNKTVLVIGRASGIARAVTEAARAAGAHVVVAGRHRDKLASAYDDPGVSSEIVDLTDDASIEGLAGRLHGVDHVVCTASARARGTLAELDRDKVRLSFDTKVIGPMMLAKHLGPKISEGGSLVIERTARTNPARRVGQSEDIAAAVLFCMANTFLTGVTLKVDGGEVLV